MGQSGEDSLPDSGSLMDATIDSPQDTEAASKKRKRDQDDTSSVATSTSTTMSTASKEMRDKQCKKCKFPGKAGHHLIRCCKCKYKYHENCHNPIPVDPDFICKDCMKRMDSTSRQLQDTFGSPSVHQDATLAPIVPAASPKEALKKTKTVLCEIENCKELIFAVPSGQRRLCQHHRILERAERAKIIPVKITRIEGRPFDKRKLNPLKPEDRELVTDRKRRRPRSSNQRQMAETVQTSQKSHRPPTRPTSSSYQANGQQSSPEIRPGSKVLVPRQSFPSIPGPMRSSTFQIQSELIRNDRLSRIDSARPSPLADESSDYSPPPPAVTVNFTSTWVENPNPATEDDDPYSPVEDPSSSFEDNEADSPGLQINQEFQAGTGESSKAVENTTLVETPNMGLETAFENVGARSQRSGTTFVECNARNLPNPPQGYNKELQAEKLKIKHILSVENEHDQILSSVVSKIHVPAVPALAATQISHAQGIQNGDIRTSPRSEGILGELGSALHQEAADIGYPFLDRGLEEPLSPNDARLLLQNGRATDSRDSEHRSISPKRNDATRPGALAATSQAPKSPISYSNLETDASGLPQSLTPLPNSQPLATRKVGGASSGWINNMQKAIERGVQEGSKRVANGGFKATQNMSTRVSNPEEGHLSVPKALKVPGADGEIAESPESPDFDNMSDISDLEPMVAFIGAPPPKPQYDGSTLDFFLKQQAQNHDHQPTPHEILASQNFGAIDPRTAWPKRISQEEYEEKQREIKVRGTRKQNFGKLLTPQVRKERAEKGWDVHQRGDWRDDADAREVVMHMEELFGLAKGVSDAFVPGVLNGKLVMREREEVVPQAGPGRRKKKVPRRELPVTGAS